MVVGIVGSDIDETVAAFAATLNSDPVLLARAAASLAEMASKSVDESLPAPALNTVVAQLVSVSYAVSATLDVVLDRWDRAGAWGYDGALSRSGWLASRFNTSRSSTRNLIQNARRLALIPVTFERMRAGIISRPVALLLGQANGLLPEAFADAETSLLEALEGLHERHARQTIDTWIAAAKAMNDSNQPDPEPEPEEPSYLTFSTLLGGRLRLEAEFDTLSAQLVRTAIENLALHDDDTTRPLRERHAEALVTLAKLGLDSGRAGHVQRPHIIVTMTLDDFEHRTGTSARFADGTPVPEDVLWDLFCHSDIHPLLTTATHTPLAMGRARRFAVQHQRLAMRQQWDGCGFPGCDQPYEHCQAHHETLPWDDGGLTNTDDMIPLCNGHHRLKHRAHWNITMDPDGTIHAHRPDGHHLTDTRRRHCPSEPPDAAKGIADAAGPVAAGATLASEAVRPETNESFAAPGVAAQAATPESTAGECETAQSAAGNAVKSGAVLRPMVVIDGWGVQRTNVIDFADITHRRALLRQLDDYRNNGLAS